MKKTKLDGLHYWGRLQADRQIDFNGFFWAREDGGVLIDPMEMSAEERALLDGLGGARYVVLTNFDHLRATAELKAELGLEVWAPAAERGRFGDAAAVIDHEYSATSGLPANLGIDAFEMRGGKSEVEMALYLKPLKALLFGDVVRSHESGILRMLPDPKVSDRSALVESIKALSSLALDAVLLGDGDSHFYRADQAFAEFVTSLDE
ncbi:MAG: glyoxylase-like metal-dependent hydrolase (beta-lactamase superfamily II) [Planctomycetota bacterium]|jgi:glyoxylase-like metal-dependent hydrolase (beta-lactamase superfamily II)